MRSHMYVIIVITMPLIIPNGSRPDRGLVMAEQQQNTVEEYADDDDHFCKNVDIRNNLERLNKIKNCTVITGFLQLVLIERIPSQEFDKFQFPNLREVTGFVLFFRVFNLISLRNLFPNLMMIRGQELIGNYALIFYDLPHLQEIGLKNLIAIQRGFVYTQYCPLLCHTDTIDWASITHMTNKTRDQNRFDKPAAVCNQAEVCRGCPRKFCWGSQSCQKFHTGYDFTGNIKCDAQCIGGCTSRKDTGCRVCRGPKDGKRCVEKCLPGKVLFHETQRCISKARCVARGGLEYNGECVAECPAGYSAANVEQVDADFSNHTCYPCQDRCPKICEGMQVMYLVDAERLEGCTIINGTLQIRMVEDHPNLMGELRKMLGGIEEIMGYLKVYRSNSLPSLEFFENLMTIHGQLGLGHGNYSLMVYENSNLQRLWNYDYRTELKLLTGSMYFVYNPLLCVSQIELLKKITIYNNTNDLINVDSNGFMQSCNVVSITVKSEVLSSRNATIYWTKYNTAPLQQLVGYVIYLTPSMKERSPYDGRDVCSEYSWQSKLIRLRETKIVGNYLSYNLTGLKPLTRYAYYIKTYVADNSHNMTERRIGKSGVQYFTTKIAKPTPPLKVYTVRKTEHSITFSWKILKSEANLVQRLHVDVFIQPDDLNLLDQRNYCINPIRSVEESTDSTETCTAELCCSEDEIIQDVPDIADVDGDIFLRKKRSVQSAPEKSTFENEYSDKFQDTMYSFLSESLPSNPTVSRSRRKRETEDLRNRIYFHNFHADNKDFTVANLLPYTYYTFQLFACSAEEFTYCSPYSIYSDRTEPSPTVGQLDLIVSKQSNGSIQSDWNSIIVRFLEPEVVNGATVAFNVEIKSLNMLVPMSRRECITRLQHELAGYSYIFRNLTVGEYAVRAQVISLAGPGPHSDWYFAQVVPREEIWEDHSLRNGFVTFAVLLSLTTIGIASYYLYQKFKMHHDDKVPLVEYDVNTLAAEDGFVDCALH
ncbi:insulin-like growth factor 1 receptor isoform X2 [Wyeomyia smithii]|uniref:insulin-like growth factor 1 receptor isoform X2 n=1 Tax=Wyeomyia smithii TaxID=174621 RepID=UPI0024680DB8|nr:insulin-like growth factor 1 receptor isoform X2 [Wyeomyia smithii]XP_055549656.1 insulin-like growth factor 1 receptor isoform X2 [Wyeomyia smithii]XP_055549657.1 insulin-like growth factor 1 receptor isoform X2 [Wyeomyia smithii]